MHVHIATTFNANKRLLHELRDRELTDLDNPFFRGDHRLVQGLLNQIRMLGMTGMTITGIFAALPSNIENFYLRSIAAYIIYNAVNLSFNVGLFRNFLIKIHHVIPVHLLRIVLMYIQNIAESSMFAEEQVVKFRLRRAISQDSGVHK